MPQRLVNLLGRDWTSPRRFKAEYTSLFLGSALAGSFNNLAQRITQQTVFAVGVIDAPE